MDENWNIGLTEQLGDVGYKIRYQIIQSPYEIYAVSAAASSLSKTYYCPQQILKEEFETYEEAEEWILTVLMPDAIRHTKNGTCQKISYRIEKTYSVK
jgi:hypothetical protein